jgi:hypothetical protein
VTLQRGGLQREEVSAWPFSTEFMMLLKKTILGHIKVETRKLIMHSPDMGAGTSDNRCHESCNIRSIYDERVVWGFGLNLP